MNMPQNTAPESYYNDQTEVRPKSREGKKKRSGVIFLSIIEKVNGTRATCMLQESFYYPH